MITVTQKLHILINPAETAYYELKNKEIVDSSCVAGSST
jgi:hypothetical protein